MYKCLLFFVMSVIKMFLGDVIHLQTKFGIDESLSMNLLVIVSIID